MKNRFVLSLILGLIMTFGWIIASESAVSDISSDIVRLHIIGNSNREKDVLLKLSVRDRLLNEAQLKSDGKLNIDEIVKCSKDEIEKNGYSYDVTAEYGKFFFPTKKYENIILPAGKYDALKVKIGKAEGDNWWCVMYPPLCFNGYKEGKVSDEDLESLKNSMEKESYNLIEISEIKLKATFKIVELWQKLKYCKK